MGGFIEPLAVGKVIGDVVDPFVVAAKIGVHFGSRQVANGCKIKPSLAADRPHVRVLAASKNPTHLYTLVMVDPDAPSPSEPTFREWLHWIVVDIPEGSDATQGQTSQGKKWRVKWGQAHGREFIGTRLWRLSKHVDRLWELKQR